jgi:zinc protease
MAGVTMARPVTDFTLANGLEVVVIEDHRVPVVVNMVWYKIGAADEPRGHSGIAHFLEHLMFQGTKTVKPGDLSKMVAAQGGSDNAFTTQDQTAYFQRVAADRLDLVMGLEADRMVNLNLTEEDVATERQVILDERTQRTDSDPGSLFQEQIGAAQYLNHPYGMPVIGWRSEMEALTRQDALDFYKANYAPNNAILIVAGDATPEEVRKLAEKHFGALPPSTNITPRERAAEPPQLAARRLEMADPRVAQPYVVRSYLAPERNPGDQKQAAALTILAELLGGSPTTSLMARALMFEKPVATYVSAQYDGVSLDPTTFGLAVVPASGVSLQAAETAMDDVLKRFLKEGVDEAEFERIKTQIRAKQIYDEDNTQGAAHRYGMALTSGLTVGDVEAWPKVLADVTPDDVLAAAREVLDLRHSVTGWLHPEDAQ